MVNFRAVVKSDGISVIRQPVGFYYEDRPVFSSRPFFPFFVYAFLSRKPSTRQPKI